MTDRRKPKAAKSRPKVEKLELNRETVQELTEEAAGGAEGGNILDRSRRLACGTLACRPSKTCPTLKYDCRIA